MTEHEERRPDPGAENGEPSKETPPAPEKRGRRGRVSWRRSAALCEQELARTQAELAALKDRHLRLAAEFQNYRRRVEEEARALRQEARGRALADLFPLFDLLDLALGAANQGSSIEDLVIGLRMIESQWKSVLAQAGVTELPGEGSAFDPTIHEAVQVEEKLDLPAGTVTGVVRKGYRFQDRVLRFARVIVSEAPAGSDQENTPPQENGSSEDSSPAAPGGDDDRPAPEAPDERHSGAGEAPED